MAVVAGKIDWSQISGGRRWSDGRLRFGGRAGRHARGAEIGENGLLLHLALAQRDEVVGDGFFFVEADLAGVGAHEALIEDATGKLVEVFVLESAQHAGADLGGAGDSLERNAALLALIAKFFSERSQGRLRRAGIPSACRFEVIIGEGGDGCQKAARGRGYFCGMVVWGARAEGVSQS